MAKYTGPDDTTKEIPLLSAVYEDDIEMYVDEWQENNPDCNIWKNQSHWNCCLLYVYDHVFKPPKAMANNCKSLIDPRDIDTLENVLNKYLRLCTKYSREVSIIGFSHLTGICTDTIHSFKEGYKDKDIDYFKGFECGNRYTPEELKRKRIDIYKKITENHEESIRQKLYDSNQCTAQAILINHDFFYNAPGMKPEDGAKGNFRLTRGDLLRGISKADLGEESAPLLPKV